MPIRESVKGLRKGLDYNRTHGNWMILYYTVVSGSAYLSDVSLPMYLDVARFMTQGLPKGSFRIVDKRTKSGRALLELARKLKET